MKTAKLIIGCALVVWGLGKIAWALAVFFLPELFWGDDPSLLAESMETREYLMKDFGGLLSVLFEVVLLPALLPLVAGFIVLRVPAERIMSLARAIAAKAEKIEARPAVTPASIPTNSGSSRFVRAAKVAVVLGVALLTYAVFMDISVDSGIGRVVNLDLMSKRQTLLVVGGFALLGGIVTLFLGRVSQPTTSPSTEYRKAEWKKCPQCAEEIRIEAVKCRYCQSDLSMTRAENNIAAEKNQG